MENTKKILQGLGIPYSALISIIFGLMIVSFPIGAYLVFNSNIEKTITFEYPLTSFDFFVAGINYELPIEFELGDAFIIFWIIYVILFSIAILGPKQNFLKTLIPIIAKGDFIESNYLISAIKWFGVLILVSGIINFAQESVGISTTAPVVDNKLIQFFEVTAAPLVEELGFRVLLIGLPLFAIYSHRASFLHFFKSLWHPSNNLNISETKKAIVLIVIVSVFFGLAHIISGESWSNGKFAQATASGVIIGWVYFRSGLIPAILIHWATNFFIFSYVYLVADINLTSVQEAFSHSLIMTFEIMLVILGIIALAIMLTTNYLSKKEKRLEA